MRASGKQLLQLSVLLLLLTTTPAAGQNRTSVSLGILWDFSDALTEFKRLVTGLVQPQIRLACPNTLRTNTTDFVVDGFSVDSLPTADNLKGLSSLFSGANFIFMGIKSNKLTGLINQLQINTSISEVPYLQWTQVAPISQKLLNDVILKVFRQLISESRFPSNRLNYQAAFILRSDINPTDLNDLYSFFTEGAVYYIYNAETLEANLLSIKHANIVNIVAIVDQAQGDRIKATAFSVSMLTYQYRWIFHGPRLHNQDFDSRMVTYSNNITSIEFGRVADTLRMDLQTTHSVLLYDMTQTWRPYLQSYLCNTSSDINTTYSGFSGVFRLEPLGKVTRTRWDLQIYRGLERQKTHIGEWNSDGHFRMLSNPDPERTEFTALLELQNNPFRMVTVIFPPYVQFKAGSNSRMSVTDRLTGSYIEICRQLMRSLSITRYEFFLEPDGAFGILNGSWNGMIKTVLDGKAHMACAPITVERERKTAVKFTTVIHSSRQSLLYRSPTQDPMMELFQFIQPLDGTIWLSILGMLIFVAVVLAIMHVIIPNRGINLNPYNSIYFSFAEVVQGTSGSVPNQISGRIVTAFFWFFTLFLLLTYIANYAAFRTLEGVKPQVTSVQTMLQNNEYSFGVIRNTVTVNLLRSSTFIYMQQVYKLILESFSNGMVENGTVALSIINNASENFILINDNKQNRYLVDTGCNLISIGDFYQLKNAMAVPNASEYLRLIDGSIQGLSRNISTILDTFFTVAPQQRADCQDRSLLGLIRAILPPNPWEVKPDALTLANTMGIALINLVGCCVALALSGIERCFSRVLQNRQKDRREAQTMEAYSMAQKPTMRE